jgi:hypothetical protein
LTALPETDLGEAAALLVVPLFFLEAVGLLIVFWRSADASKDNFSDALVSSANTTSALALFPNAEIPTFKEGIRWTAMVPVALTSGLADRVRAKKKRMVGSWQLGLNRKHTRVTDGKGFGIRSGAGARREGQTGIFDGHPDCQFYVSLHIQ